MYKVSIYLYIRTLLRHSVVSVTQPRESIILFTKHKSRLRMLLAVGGEALSIECTLCKNAYTLQELVRIYTRVGSGRVHVLQGQRPYTIYSLV